MGYKTRVYVAAGWFSPNQIDTYDKMKKILDKYQDNLELFYPKEQSKDLQGDLFSPNTRKEIFERNLYGMVGADLVICSTEDKDAGSLFEAGFCFAVKRPIIYVNFHLGEAPFNLMLTESGLAIARDGATLELIIQRVLKVGVNDRQAFENFRREKNAE